MANPEKGNFFIENRKWLGGGLVIAGILVENPLMALVGLGAAFWPDKK